MPPHFALQNGGTLCATMKGTCCHPPTHKDSHPFVGGGPQIDLLQPTCHKAAARRRNNSRCSSSSIVRNIWNEVWQLLGNSQPMGLQPWDNCTHTCSAAASHHTPQSRHDKHREGVQCLQALYTTATSYPITDSHQYTHTQLPQVRCRCTRVSLLALVGRLQTSSEI